MSISREFLVDNGGLLMLIRMFGESCETVGLYDDLVPDSPKKIKAIKRCNMLWEEIKKLKEHPKYKLIF